MRILYHPAREDMSLPSVLYALSDPTRLAIVVDLAGEKEMACGAFERLTPKSTRSYHFRILREAGLTRVRGAGTQRFVQLRREDLNARFPGLLKAVLLAAASEEAEPVVAAPGRAAKVAARR